MSISETVVFSNSSGGEAWFEIADEAHDFVQFANTGTNYPVLQIAVGPDTPTEGIPGVAGNNAFPFMCIEHANTKVWAKLRNGTSVAIIRGDAKVTPSLN